MTKINLFKPSVITDGIDKYFWKKIIVLLCLFAVTFMFQGSKAKAQATADYDWNNVAIGGGGFVSAIITSKTEQNLVYARTDVGGAYRWDASTSSWISLLDWVSDDEVGYLGVESLAIDPQAPNKVYMLVGISYFNGGKTAILRSDDYGNTFTITDVTNQFKAHGNGMGRQTGEKLVVDPNNSNILYCGTRWNGLFKSTDAGATWSRVNSLNVTTTPNENGISLVILDGSSVSGGATQRIIVGVSRSGSTNMYLSDDSGQTFSAIPGATTTYMPHRAAMANNGDLYITYGNGAGPHAHWSVPEPMDQGQIWKYNISSGVWTNITPSGYTNAFGGISVDPNNPNRMVASTINTYLPQNGAWGERIFLSTNGGSTWIDVIDRGFNLDPNGNNWIAGNAIHWAGSLEFDPFDSKKVWVTSGNGIFRTEDIDATLNVWKFQVKGLEETVPLGVESIPNGPVISVIGDYDGFRHTDVTQYVPRHNPSMGTTTGLAVAAQNTSKIVRVGNSMYYSTDMGISWNQCSLKGPQGQVTISADGNTFLHCPSGSNKTYRSTNNGNSWFASSGLNISDARPLGDPVNPNKFYVYNPTNGAILVSTNGGSSFSGAGSTGNGGSKVIRVAPGREGDLWVPLYGGGLARSTNSGQSFSTISGVSYCGAVGFGKEASGSSYPTIYIWGTVNNVKGLFRSTDQGASWVRVNDDAHEYGGPGNGQFVVGDMNVFGRVYMSTAGRGIVYGGPATTGTNYTLTTSTNGSGTIDLNPAGGTYASGTVVTVTANPASGWQFSGWSGDLSGSLNPTTITMNSNKSITATFTSSGGNPTLVHVQSIVTGSQSSGRGSKQGTAAVTIYNDLGNAVSGATVTGTFSGSFNETVSGTTDSNGTVTLITNGTAKGNVTVDLCVDDVSHSSLMYAPAQNVITCIGSGSSFLVTLNDLRSLEKVDQVNFEIYPNPAPKGKFAVILPEIAGAATISIYNGQGKLLYQKYSYGGKKQEIDHHLNAGFYLVKVSSDKLDITKKLIIK